MITNVQARALLVELGWPASVPLPHALQRFQAGLATLELNATGQLDLTTAAALQSAVARRSQGRGTASEHFSFSEFACHCGGTYGCDVIWPSRQLIARLELLRAAAYPHGLQIISGCRCPKRNAKVGGVPNSQHLYGRAADIPPVAAVEVAERCGFTGVGFSREHGGLVVHADVRTDAVTPFPDGP